jgi:hypothetical protein
MTSLTLLQIAHLSLLFAIPITYALLGAVAGSEDNGFQKLGLLISIVGVAWGSAIAVASVVHGSKDSVFKTVWASYRKLLVSKLFLVASIFMFLLIESFLFWNLVFYRSVEFYSPDEVTLILNNDIGNPETIGNLKARTKTKLRLKVGSNFLAYRSIESNTIGSLPPIHVSPWWSNQPIETIRISKVVKYESTK